MPETGDEFGQSTVDWMIKLASFLGRHGWNLTKSGINRISANSQRDKIDEAYQKGCAEAWANKPDEVNKSAKPQPGDPEIEFTTRKIDPHGDILGDWLKAADIPFERSEATVPPTTCFNINDRSAESVRETLENEGISSAVIEKVGNNVVGIYTTDERKTIKCLNDNKIAFDKLGTFDGLATFRVAEVNLNNTMSLIDNAILSEIPGIDEKRFPNIDEMHMRAGIEKPDFGRGSVANAIENSEKIRSGEIDQKISDVEGTSKDTKVYCYPRSYDECLGAVKTMRDVGMKNFELVDNVDFNKLGHYILAINELELSQCMAGLDKEHLDDLVESLNNINNGELAMNDIISLSTIDETSKLNEDGISTRDITLKSDNLASLSFETVGFDNQGKILTDRFEAANIPYVVEMQQFATEHTNEKGLINISFAAENSEAVVSITDALLDKEHPIRGIDEARFPNLDELKDFSEKINSGDIDLNSAKIDPFIPVHCETQEQADLLRDCLYHSGISFKQGNTGFDFNISNASLVREGIEGTMKDYVSHAVGKRASWKDGRVSVRANADPIQGVKTNVRHSYSKDELLQHAQTAATELSKIDTTYTRKLGKEASVK